MDFHDPGWPLIDDFFARLGAGRKAETVRRYARVRLRLYDFLDADDLTEWLGDDDATLLAAEREFVREGAVWTLFGLDGVLRCLPGVVAEGQLPVSAAEARMQVSVVKRFIADLRTRHLVTSDCVHSLLVARRAVMRARADLEHRISGEPALPWDQVIGARFRQQPGPQW